MLPGPADQFISAAGITGALWSGWLFAVLAVLFVALKVVLFDGKRDTACGEITSKAV